MILFISMVWCKPKYNVYDIFSLNCSNHVLATLCFNSSVHKHCHINHKQQQTEGPFGYWEWQKARFKHRIFTAGIFSWCSTWKCFFTNRLTAPYIYLSKEATLLEIVFILTDNFIFNSFIYYNNYITIKKYLLILTFTHYIYHFPNHLNTHTYVYNVCLTYI